MFRGKNVLAIGPHPDDIEYGCFGTLLQLSKSNLYCYVMSWGGKGDESSGVSRMEETKASLKVLYPEVILVEPTDGIDPVFYHQYVASIEKIVRDYHIDLVLAPTRHDTHQDHRLAHDIVVTALRNGEEDILFYDPHCRTLDFKPNLFVDISNQMDEKIKALTSHKTQNGKYYMEDEFIREFHARNVAPYRGAYCEAFEVGRIWIYS